MSSQGAFFTNNGGDDDSISAVYSVTTVVAEPNDSCAICLENFQDGVNLTEFVCGHRFCFQCGADWIARQRRLYEDLTCPLCRRVSRPDEIQICLNRVPVNLAGEQGDVEPVVALFQVPVKQEDVDVGPNQHPGQQLYEEQVLEAGAAAEVVDNVLLDVGFVPGANDVIFSDDSSLSDDDMGEDSDTESDDDYVVVERVIPGLEYYWAGVVGSRMYMNTSDMVVRQADVIMISES
jgi:hypothetical protein